MRRMADGRSGRRGAPAHGAPGLKKNGTFEHTRTIRGLLLLALAFASAVGGGHRWRQPLPADPQSALNEGSVTAVPVLTLMLSLPFGLLYTLA